jgi:hypothetical protein
LPNLSQTIDNVGSAGAATQLIFCAFPVRERQTELGQHKVSGGYAHQSPRAAGRRLASEKRLRTVRPMIFAAENSAQSAHVGRRRRNPLQRSGELILTDPGRQLAKYPSFFIPVRPIGPRAHYSVGQNARYLARGRRSMHLFEKFTDAGRFRLDKLREIAR